MGTSLPNKGHCHCPLSHKHTHICIVHPLSILFLIYIHIPVLFACCTLSVMITIVGSLVSGEDSETITLSPFPNTHEVTVEPEDESSRKPRGIISKYFKYSLVRRVKLTVKVIFVSERSLCMMQCFLTVKSSSFLLLCFSYTHKHTLFLSHTHYLA